MISGPFVRVLGTAQDGGFPHAACSCPRCELARREPGARRRVSSLAIAHRESGDVLLIDATPDIRQQLDAVRDLRNAERGRVDRSPVSGVMLTHAHLGHYTGLAFFGFEAVHTQSLPVYCTASFADYLRANGPWSQLVKLGNVDLRPIRNAETFEPMAGVRVTPLTVPHRDEFSDTVGYLLEGERARLLYVPDTDSWDSWSRPLIDVLRDVDMAILDGTF